MVPGEVYPGHTDSSGDVAKGVLNLMGGVTNQANVPLRQHGRITQRRQSDAAGGNGLDGRTVRMSSLRCSPRRVECTASLLAELGSQRKTPGSTCFTVRK
jgi:hypothetical protein